MESISSVGRGYYNYYHDKSRYETPDGKAKTAWYDRDLTTEEIGKNNAGVLNKDYQCADLCRKLADAYQSIAESNRAKYSTAQEVKDAVWAKYTATGEYSAYSHEERAAMARNEIHMTLFGTIDNWNNDPHLKGTVSKNTHNGSNETESRAFNIKTLGSQFMNLWNNNGIDTSKINGSSFLFCINGMNLQATITLLNGEKQDSGLLDLMTKALNSNENASNLFYNLLYDANKQGILPHDSLAKWKLYSNFKEITGLDITTFKQTEKGFVDNNGVTAKEIFKESLKSTTKVPAEFKGAAYEYFEQQEKEAMKYDISKVPDLNLSMEYRNGYVYLNGDQKHIDYCV